MTVRSLDAIREGLRAHRARELTGRRRAAVAIALYAAPDGPEALFIERAERFTARGLHHAAAKNSIAGREPTTSRVFGDQPAGARIALDKRHLRGAAAQRFEPDGAGSREPIEESRPLDARR